MPPRPIEMAMSRTTLIEDVSDDPSVICPCVHE